MLRRASAGGSRKSDEGGLTCAYAALGHGEFGSHLASGIAHPRPENPVKGSAHPRPGQGHGRAKGSSPPRPTPGTGQAGEVNPHARMR